MKNTIITIILSLIIVVCTTLTILIWYWIFPDLLYLMRYI